MNKICFSSLELLRWLLKGVLTLEQGEIKKTISSLKKGLKNAEAQSLIPRGCEELVRKNISSLQREAEENKMIDFKNFDLDSVERSRSFFVELVNKEKVTYQRKTFSPDSIWRDTLVIRKDEHLPWYRAVEIPVLEFFHLLGIKEINERTKAIQVIKNCGVVVDYTNPYNYLPDEYQGNVEKIKDYIMLNSVNIKFVRDFSLSKWKKFILEVILNGKGGISF